MRRLRQPTAPSTTPTTKEADCDVDDMRRRRRPTATETTPTAETGYVD
jgi:hypothetical protein